MPMAGVTTIVLGLVAALAIASCVAVIAVQLWQIDDRPTYEFAVARSLAQSFWHWLEASAAQYGLEFVDR